MRESDCPRWRCLGQLLGPVLAAGLGLGCTTYGGKVRPVENMLAAGQPGEALALLEKNGDSGLGEVLFQLNRG
ncbi:MAG: hypothetical protein PVI15_10815, partial [Chromatiales bacterium]